ncbi:MAG: BMP family protein [Eubacteriales bacterium]|nr:BMP family protein [Eubacteriales bacterium]
MKEKFLKTLSLCLVLVLMLLTAVACDSKENPEPAGTNPQGSTEPVQTGPGVRTDGKADKVGLILEGAISDMSWNSDAHRGLEKIGALGAEINYTENTGVSEAPDAIRAFAESGCNIIFLSSSSFQDVTKESAKNYPEVLFFVINATVDETNVRSVQVQDFEQGFLMGALASLLSESGTVGFIGGFQFEPMIKGGQAFSVGAEYVNPDCKTIVEFTGDNNDVRGAKELAKAMAQQGADCLGTMAGPAALGVVEAAEEEGIFVLPPGQNMNSVGPNAAIAPVMKDTSIAYEAVYKMFKAGELPDGIIKMGSSEGVVYVGDFYLDVDQAIVDEIRDINDKLAKGEIVIDLG